MFDLSLLLKVVCMYYRADLGLCPANEGRRYQVTPSLIGWAQTLNQPYITYHLTVIDHHQTSF